MWHLATFSEIGCGRHFRLIRVFAFATVIAVLQPPLVVGQVLLTQDEALRLAFPEPATIERRTAFLEQSQIDSVAMLAGSKPAGTLVTYYVGRSGSESLGAAYFDGHRVRTLPEVLMIVVTPGGRVERIEILRFSEPREYMAPDGWLDRFNEHHLDGDLENKNAVAGITGATLTSRAVTNAVRRTLALHEILDPLGAGQP